MYFVYRTTNLVTNEYYIGVHKENKKYPYYLGSGLRLKRSIKKYGRKVFRREILFSFKTAAEAFSKERDVLNEHLGNSLCLNLCEGGRGGAHFQGRTHTEETKQRIAKTSAGRTFKKTKEMIDNERKIRYHKNGGSWFSAATIEKIREKAKNRGKQTTNYCG